MKERRKKNGRSRNYGRSLAEEFCALSRRILRAANLGIPRSEFTQMVLEEMADFSECDQTELHVNEGVRYYYGVFVNKPEKKFSFSVVSRNGIPEEFGLHALKETEEGRLLWLGTKLATGQISLNQPYFTSNGAFWVNDTSLPIELNENKPITIGGVFRSLAILTFSIGESSHGLVFLKSRTPGFFRGYEVEFYQGVAQTLGIAIADRRAQAALRERVKELTCLYEVDKILGRGNEDIEKSLKKIVEKLPVAWLYPEIASARIELDGKSYFTENYKSGIYQQQAEITVHGRRRGLVEITYSETRPELDEGPFLKEERHLIDAVAREVGIFIERWEAAQEKKRLEAQLRHADRLATIGQLAAGVAHELNEPLANILGFAQLLQKTPGMPVQAEKDVERIVKAVLHAREVISKLMLFARQKPPNVGRVNLNQLINDGLYFLTSRCVKAGIEVIRDLAPELPEIVADPAQIQQVLVNLVVNAIQAMPQGGKLFIRTTQRNNTVVLIVEDTGIGMTEEVKQQIFIPFFTTKPVGEGTGLGLSVVHGIVSGHGGSINVESEPGKGSRFEVILPIRGPVEKRGDER